MLWSGNGIQRVFRYLSGSIRAFAASPGFGKAVQLPRGYKRPTRRVMKSPLRYPNVKTKAYEFNVCLSDFLSPIITQLSSSSNGTFNITPPYPPRVNRSIEVSPAKGDKRNHWPTQEHKDYPLRWKNVEYKYTPVLRSKPHGGDRWTGKIERVESDSK